MTDKIPLLSLIIPLHNEAPNLTWHHEAITKEMIKNKFNYEIIYIDDGSSDNSLQIITKLATETNVHFVSFSRNFGKEAATTAGLKKAIGDAAIIIDADGQHPVELIKEFVNQWNHGYQVVIGIRESNKGEGAIKSFGSKAFYFALKIIGSNNSSTSGLTDFRLIDRKVINEYNKLTEHNRVTRNLIDWLGFKRKLVPFDANARHSGKASYSVRKLAKLAIDGIVKHSTRPLKLIGLLGIAISIISFLVSVFIIIEQYGLGDPLNLGITASGFLGLFLSFMIGIVLLCQGLLALYLENVYYETQNRPIYIINEEN